MLPPPPSSSSMIRSVLSSPYYRSTNWRSKAKTAPVIKRAPRDTNVQRSRCTTPCILNHGQGRTRNELHVPTAFPENDAVGPRNWSFPSSTNVLGMQVPISIPHTPSRSSAGWSIGKPFQYVSRSEFCMSFSHHPTITRQPITAS